MLTGLLPVCCTMALAETQIVTVTNYVTVTITNVVTVTNIVPPTPAAVSTAAIAAGVPPAPHAAPIATTNAAATKYPWQNATSIGATMTRGNSDTTLFTADYSIQRKTPFDEYKLDLNGAYGDQNSKQTVNNYKASAQWNHLFTPYFYTYGRTDGTRDIIADLDYRATIGPGLGYYLLKDTNTFLAPEIGGGFEAERLDNTGDQTFGTVRLADRFEHKVNEHVRLWQNAEILPQVDAFENYIVNFEAGVEASLSKSFSLKTFLDDNYDDRPAPGKFKNDAKIVAALGYKF